MTHTPGPWIWADLDRGLYGAGPDNAVLQYYAYEGMHLSGKTEEEQKANRDLIAAAPDMLEALKAIQKIGVLNPTNSPAVHKYIADMNTAIAKATGEK